MIDLQTEDIRIIEDEILWVYEYDRNNKRRPCPFDWTKNGALIDVRKELINKRVLKHQEEILPDIIAFNDALTNALRELYDRAYAVYDSLKDSNFGDIRVHALLYLGEYPKNHPVQTDDREDFWYALRDEDWNKSNENEIQLFLPEKEREFESNIGMEDPNDNWNEGLDRELTKDLHLTMAFHKFFAHSNFAITDFIYVREFITEINVEIEKRETF